MLEGGEIHAGCNVENASYGLTICAERNAVFSAVAGHSGKPKIVGVVVTNEKGIPCSPCGACRQVIAEFGPEAWVWYLGENGMVCKTARELLPDGFIFDRA
jgi:cytidine deaminase